MNRRALRAAAVAAVPLGLLAACTSGGAGGGGATSASVVTIDPSGASVASVPSAPSSEPAEPGTTPVATAAGTSSDSVTLVAYDSFVSEGTPIGDALDAFTARTGVEVDVVIGGDAGTMVSKAVLTAGNPEGDVMFGIDSTLLSRALDADVFEPYTSTELDALDPDLVALAPDGAVTPVDFGDVCLNYDIAWFDERGIDPPDSLEDLTDPVYRDLLVVEDPAASSPGLAFLLATIAHFGADRWQAWWADLRANGVQVVQSWTDAYYTAFSGSSGAGPRPIVVSYGSSPPAEVIFADPPRDDAPTAVVPSTCFRQVEFAGILRGTDDLEAAQQLIDFLAGAEFQSQVALNLFVYPARTDVELPPEFTRFSVQPDDPLTMDPAEIDANREAWVDAWTQTVLR